MKDAIDTVKLYGMYAKENLDKASNSFQTGFKKIGEGVNTAKERITGALELMGKVFVALGGTIALISWQGSKYAEDLWRAWVDASGKIAASSKDLDKFGSSVIGMATKSKFGMTEVSNAARLAANFNLNEAQTLEAVAAAMDYSMGVGDDLMTSINGISRAMMVFRDKNLSGKQAADILAKANIDSRVSAEDMELTLRALGPIANKLGWDFKDVVSMLAVFKDSGIDGGRAMMGLASVLNDVMDPTSVLGKEISETGISIRDSSGKVKNIVELLTELKRAGSDTSTVFNHLSAIIGPGLSNVVEKGTSALDKYNREFAKADGFAKKLSSTFEMTLPGAFQFFVARMKDIPTVLSFFMKDSLTSFFTPMQKALGELTTVIDKSSFAKKLDQALTPVFKSIGGWIGNILKNWTNFINKLTPADIEAGIKKIQGFFKELWDILKKAFSGIDFAALIKGLFETLIMITLVVSKFMKWFIELPNWAKNIGILTAAFVALGGASVVTGLTNLVVALFNLGKALNAIKVAGGLSMLSKLGGVPGLIIGGATVGGIGAFTAGKEMQTKNPELAEKLKWPALLTPLTSLFSAGVELQKHFSNKTINNTKPESFNNEMTNQLENMNISNEDLNKEIENTKKSIEDETNSFIKTFGVTGEKIITLNNKTLDMFIQSENRIKDLQLKLQSLENRIASLRFSNKNK